MAMMAYMRQSDPSLPFDCLNDPQNTLSASSGSSSHLLQLFSKVVLPSSRQTSIFQNHTLIQNSKLSLIISSFSLRHAPLTSLLAMFQNHSGAMKPPSSNSSLNLMYSVVTLLFSPSSSHTSASLPATDPSSFPFQHVSMLSCLSSHNDELVSIPSPEQLLHHTHSYPPVLPYRALPKAPSSIFSTWI